MAIIALLAAILFPVFARAREKARQASCASNLKQIGLGLLQYVQDYDSTSPQTCDGVCGYYSNSANPYWMDLIYPYVKSQALFTCPDDNTLSANYNYAGNYAAGDSTSNQDHFGSYTANDVCDPAWGAANAACTPPFSFQQYTGVPVSVTTQSMMATPATTVWVSESGSNGQGAGMGTNGKVSLWPWGFSGASADSLAIDTTDLPYPFLYDANSGQNYRGFIAARHTNMTNVLWCDGHVKAVTLDSLNTKGTTGYYTYFTCQADPN